MGFYIDYILISDHCQVPLFSVGTKNERSTRSFRFCNKNQANYYLVRY